MTNLREKLARAIFDAHQATPRDRSELDAADAVLSTLTAEGMVIVPREPSQAMIDAAHELDDDLVAVPIHDHLALLCTDGPARIYKAMITALEGNRE